LQVASYKLQVAGCKLQVASYKLQVTSCRLQVASYKLQDTSYKIEVTGCRCIIICIRFNWRRKKEDCLGFWDLLVLNLLLVP